MYFNYKLGDPDKCIFCGSLEGNTKEHFEKYHPIKLALIYPEKEPNVNTCK